MQQNEQVRIINQISRFAKRTTASTAIQAEAGGASRAGGCVGPGSPSRCERPALASVFWPFRRPISRPLMKLRSTSRFHKHQGKNGGEWRFFEGQKRHFSVTGAKAPKHKPLIQPLLRQPTFLALEGEKNGGRQLCSARHLLSTVISRTELGLQLCLGRDWLSNSYSGERLPLRATFCSSVQGGCLSNGQRQGRLARSLRSSERRGHSSSSRGLIPSRVSVSRYACQAPQASPSR